MHRCKDTQIKDMLHHYELGLLSDDDRDTVEQHLLVCEECFTSFAAFQETAQHIRQSPRIREALAELAADSPSETQPVAPRRWLRAMVPAALFTVALIVVLVIQPWHIEIHPGDDAIAAENRLVIMTFDNLADPIDSSRAGEMIADLLIADLSESHFVQTVSRQRMHDLISRLHAAESPLNLHTLGTDVASRTHSSWLLLGSILQQEPNLIVTTQLIATATGQVRATHRLVTTDGDIFGLVDSLTITVKQDMALPDAAFHELDRSVADVTTSSYEAYRYFLDGIEQLDKFYTLDARASFKNALLYDSTFAMAYYYLADLEDSGYIEQAVRFAENTSWRERMYIQAKYAIKSRDYSGAIAQLEQLLERDPEEKKALADMASLYYARGDYRQSVAACQRSLVIDPGDKNVYNLLAYSYRELGNYDSSIWAITKYIEMAPDEPNPYDTRGDLYASGGRLDEALSSYREALRIGPDFFNSMEKYAHMLACIGDYLNADSCYQILCQWDSPLVRSRGRQIRTYVQIHQGKFERALEMLDDGIKADSAEGEFHAVAAKCRLKALIYEATARPQAALAAMQDCLDSRGADASDAFVDYRDTYIRLLAVNGRYREAETQLELLREGREKSPPSPARYWATLGTIAYIGGNLDSAVACFDRFAAESDISPYFNRRFYMAQAYFDAERLGDAVTGLEQLTRSCGSIELYWGILQARAHYLLGRAYEQSRWYDRAADQYRIFVNQWQNADYVSPDLADARQRLNRLIHQ